MKLEKLLNKIRSLGQARQKGYWLNIRVNTEKINKKSVFLLYFILNNYEEYFFITIENIPCCLMPDASEHLVYNPVKNKKYLKDKVCNTCFFKNRCPGWQKDINTDGLIRTPLKDRPKEVVIEVTTKCNLNCKTCTLDKEKGYDIDFEKVKNIINECKKLDIKAIRFTGGEPLLNKDIGKILTLARRNNLYTLLNTNATLANKNTLKLLKENVDNVLISLQGFNKKSDKFLTGSNLDFNEKISCIIKIKSRVPITRLGTVISKTLLDNFESYVNLIQKLEIDTWELYRPMLRENSQEFAISPEEIIKIMKQLLILKKKNMKVKIANPVPFCLAKNMSLSIATLLGAIADDGHSRIVFSTKGYFKPSYFMDVNLGKNIKDAWGHLLIKKLNSTEYLPQECKTCDYLKWCMGSSRVAAKAANNTYFSKDPLMPL